MRLKLVWIEGGDRIRLRCILIHSLHPRYVHHGESRGADTGKHGRAVFECHIRGPLESMNEQTICGADIVAPCPILLLVYA